MNARIALLALLCLGCRTKEFDPSDSGAVALEDTGAAADTAAVPTDTGEPGDTGEPVDTGDSGDTAEPVVDADSDGFDETQDCDDSNSEIHPDADEVCDGVDNDCDLLVDQGAIDTLTWYRDADGDGFGDAASPVASCDAPSGYVDDATDCDDTNPDVHPAGAELCNGLDDDCDSLVDDDDPDVTGQLTWHLDADGDGHGGTSYATLACDAPSGFAASSDDCDDGEAAANPSANEACDALDNDCDSLVDESGASGEQTWYADADGDGYGDAAVSSASCDAATGYVDDATDCDDTDSAVNPAADEWCNGLDDDCDGLVDDDDTVTDAGTFYADTDGDGFGDASAPIEACEQPSASATDATDCDDTSATVNPDASELCNGTDDDCDALVDDDDPDLADALTWYLDYDADGYGNAAFSTEACSAPASYGADATDCNDYNSEVHPAATEVCNGTDDDCDGLVDDDDTVSDPSTFYADADSDGYGDPSAATTACEAPSGSSTDGTDCDDGNSEVHPAATEVCNGTDDDCDGLVDDDDPGLADASTWSIDYDGDSYGSTTYTLDACDQPSGYVADASDCDDTDSGANPGAEEACDGADNDCDDDVDEDTTGTTTWYADADGDGFGDPDTSSDACLQPSDTTDDASDCDDGDAGVNPDAEEVCDGVDSDCDGDADNGVLGSDATCAAESCLAILDDGASEGDGDYWLEVEGSTDTWTCDMSTDGGGWTLVFTDGFDDGVDAGWDYGSTYDCSGWGVMLGGYGLTAGTELTLDTTAWSIDHSEAWVELTYAKLDSWDGETAYVELDGVTLWSESLQYYDGAEVCGWNRGWSGSYDEQHFVSEITSHSDDALQLVAGSELDQDAGDESFGIDDVAIWVR